jgi:hypothetical protein
VAVEKVSKRVPVVMPLYRPRKKVNIHIDYHERVTLDDEHAGMAM